VATTINLTQAMVGTVVVSTAGSLTAVQTSGRGRGRFSLSDPQLNVVRGFWQPVIAFGDDQPRPVSTADRGSHGVDGPYNLVGAPIAFTSLRLDALPAGGQWQLTIG
jgi:hypothetical protein